MDLPEDLPLAAFLPREDPRDALVLPRGVPALAPGRPIGSSSLRRQLQLRALFPGAEVKPVRGNVLTRLRKLDEGEYAALVLAAAGLKRLGLEERICRYFAPEEMLPAAGQGILAVQCRRDFDMALLDGLGSREAAVCARTERAFVAALDGGCSSPVAAYAVTEGDTVTVTGMYVDGAEKIWRGTASGPCPDGPDMAARLAKRLKEDAAWQGK